MLKNIIFILIIFCSLASAAPKGQSIISGLPKTIAKDSTLTINTVKLTDGAVINTRRLKRASTFTLSAPDLISLINVSYLSRKTKTMLSGQSRKVGPFIKTKKAFDKALKIKLKKRSRPAALALSLQKATLNSNKILRVGIPNDGIIVSGTKAEAWMPKAQIQMLLTTMIQNASCYNKNDGYVFIELDPYALEARQFEFDLCASGRADPATCVADAYQPPTILIKGELIFNENNASLNLRQTDTNGTTLFQTSASGSIKDIASWEALTKEVAKSLNANICMNGDLSVTKSTCEIPACDMPCIEGTAFRQLPTIEGTAKGQVGASVSVGFNRDFATINCGQWSIEQCQANVCCQRTSDDQPEQTTFSAVLDLYKGACLCPSGQRVIYDVITQLRMGTPIEIEKSIDCPT